MIIAPNAQVAALAQAWAALVDGHPGYVLTPGADANSIAAIQIVGQLGLATANTDGTWTSTATTTTPKYTDYATLIEAPAPPSGGSNLPLLIGAAAVGAWLLFGKR